MGKTHLFLHIDKGPKRGSCLQCSPSTITTIGRSRGNTLQIKDTGISQKHLYFRWRDSGWTVTDGGSSNGTIVNNVAIDPEKQIGLKTGDVIKLGEETTIKIEIPATTFAVDNPSTTASRAKASSKRKITQKEEASSVPKRSSTAANKLDLDNTTVGEWLQQIKEDTPKFLKQISEALIQEMKLELKQFDDYMYSLKLPPDQVCERCHETLA